MDMKLATYIQKLNPGPEEKLKMEMNHAYQKWQFLIDVGIIKKKGWMPET